MLPSTTTTTTTTTTILKSDVTPLTNKILNHNKLNKFKSIKDDSIESANQDEQQPFQQMQKDEINTNVEKMGSFKIINNEK